MNLCYCHEEFKNKPNTLTIYCLSCMKLINTGHRMVKETRRIVINPTKEFDKDVKDYGLSFSLIPRKNKMIICMKELQNHKIDEDFIMCINGLCKLEKMSIK